MSRHVDAPASQAMTEAARQSEALDAELNRARELLYASLDGLYPPLSSLARAAVIRAEPLRRARLVLAVAVGENGDDLLLRERRILLAAALEMLTVALDIHSALLRDSGLPADRNLDKSIVGSTILTADYCFGRAAWMAAQTESPMVVDRFAQALKNVSVGLLRASLDPAAHGPVASTAAGLGAGEEPPSAYDAPMELALACVGAAAHLAGLSAQAQAAAHAFAPHVAQGVAPASAAEVDALLRPLSAAQQGRWRATLAQLAAERS